MATTQPGRPGPNEYGAFYQRYLDTVPTDDVIGFLGRQLVRVESSLANLPSSLAGHRYAAEKWSVRQALGHVLDGERVFGYRALTFARGDNVALPGFEADAWVNEAAHDAQALAAIVDEFALVRRANLALFSGLPQPAWLRTGTASGMVVSVRALAFIIAGHAEHHFHILRERYGVPIEP